MMGDQPEVVMSNGGSPPRLSTVSVPRLSIASGRRGSGPAVRRGQTGVAEVSPDQCRLSLIITSPGM